MKPDRIAKGDEAAEKSIFPADLLFSNSVEDGVEEKSDAEPSA
jgi:hypothetical protein